MPFRVGTQLISSLKVGWSPSYLTNAKYWWTADEGITVSGGVITAWEDQINGFTMTPATGPTNPEPTLTTNSDLNNQKVVRFNGTSNLLRTDTPPADIAPDGVVTQLVVYKLNDTSTGAIFVNGGGYDSGGSLGRWFWGVDSSNLSINTSFGTPTDFPVEAPARLTPSAMKVRLDFSTGGEVYYAKDTLTETLGASGIGGFTTWSSLSRVTAGATLNTAADSAYLASYTNVDIAESVVIYGTPTSLEMEKWKAYVNGKYGTIII